MNIIDQVIYDIELQENDELGRELLEIVEEEEEQNKSYRIIIQQVIKVNQNRYTAIINYVEKD